MIPWPEGMSGFSGALLSFSPQPVAEYSVQKKSFERDFNAFNWVPPGILSIYLFSFLSLLHFDQNMPYATDKVNSPAISMIVSWFILP